MNMNVMEAIKGRRSIRCYDAKPVEDEKLNAVLEAARLAPTASNRQELKIIIVRDKAKIEALAAAAGNQKFVGEAPAVIVICGLSGHIMMCGQSADTINCSIAMSYITLEAYEQGLGTCWLGMFYEDKVKALLKIPASASVVAISPLGYPKENPPARPRRKMSEIICRENFS